MVFFLPDGGLSIVVLSNGDNKHDQELVAYYRIIEDLLGLERKESERLIGIAGTLLPHKSLHDAGNNSISAGNDALPL